MLAGLSGLGLIVYYGVCVPTGERMEVFELDGHPYYVGCQFHPEFKSRPTKPSPLFVGLLHAASGLPLPGR